MTKHCCFYCGQPLVTLVDTVILTVETCPYCRETFYGFGHPFTKARWQEGERVLEQIEGMEQDRLWWYKELEREIQDA